MAKQQTGDDRQWWPRIKDWLGILLVIGMPLVWRSRAALLKGLSLGAMGLWVLGSTAHQVLVLGVPRAEVMGVIGFLALAANLTSVLLLLRYRDGDANVRSVWLCSRNMRSAIWPWSWQRVAYGRPPPHGPT
jgi:hypothetical protein